MWEAHHTTTQSLRWREFNWKNMIRYFITPKKKKANRYVHTMLETV